VSEETVRIDAGDDYYTGPYFKRDNSGGIEVPREQVERWEAAEAAWLEVQEEITTVLRADSWKPPTTPLGEVLKDAYGDTMRQALTTAPVFRRLSDEEPE
jgi:hypothetical protein